MTPSIKNSSDGTEVKCPSCSGDSIGEEVIESVDLINLWKSQEVDVSHLFESEKIEKKRCLNCGLGFYYPFVLGDNGFYSTLACWDWYYKHGGKTEYEYTKKLLKQGMRVLDVGCGIGEFSEYMPNDVSFCGAELSSKSVEIAKSFGRNVQQMDVVKSLSLISSKFDVVTSFQVLEHISDINTFFEALVDACRPGGLVVIAVPNNDSFISRAVNNNLNMPPHHVLLWNKKSLYSLADRYSLAVEAYLEEDVSDVHLVWYWAVILNYYLSKLMFGKLKSVDLSFGSKLTRKISFIMAKLVSKVFQPKGVGHSSVVVFRKGC